ncbi:mechanosensitive ion channel family protein [Deinococcus yavapaiensis]|uniref:Small conductance mechanosensitive channel n=1 Tax=Deinococcus yavapaiensis KR-236 TaxID=694435 RepID=A0A318RYM4_9DEIO|nr:mechanosensitive ion channel domain-containing protein [Deinococcus yavapaiensis]PYE48147.1 small conductance mechanosensitive channel [Deinococcus yavapaiensis KR-236]
MNTVLSTLNRPDTWFELLVAVLLVIGAWRLGSNLLDLITARLPERTRRAAVLVWTAAAAFVLCAVAANILEAPLAWLAEPGALIGAYFRETIGRVLAIVVLASVAWSLVSAASARIVPADEFTRRSVRVQTLKGVVESTLRVVIVVAALVTVMQNVGLNATTLLAGVSVLGLAVSFGAQSLIKDVITGFFILLEDQYGVGDVVTINNGPLTGVVERLNLRVTMLRALDGTLHVVPNGQISTVSVMSKDWSRFVAAVGLPPTADVDVALSVLTNVSHDLYRDEAWTPKFLEEPTVEGVTSISKDGFEVRALFKVLPKEQWAVGREFNRRMKHALDEAGLGGLRPQLMVLRREDGADPDEKGPRGDGRQLPES